MTANKQLQRTVTPHRGDAASASFHYALASRFTRRRAAAELRRYTATEAIGSLEGLFEELHRGGEGPVTRSSARKAHEADIAEFTRRSIGRSTHVL